MNSKGKCVCEICTCGRHRCPHNRGSIGKQPVKAACILSEYQISYPANRPFTAPSKNMKPPTRQYTINVPLETESTYMRTYTPHPTAEPTASVKVKTEFTAPTEAMDASSSYKDDFQAKPGKRSKSFKPENSYSQDENKLQDKTMYRMSYTPHSVKDLTWCRATPIKHKECLRSDQSGKFEGRTTMKEDFKSHAMPERATLSIPVTETTISKDKFDGDSTYKQQYTPKAAERVKNTKKTGYNPNVATFFGESTMRAAYKSLPSGQKAKSFKPNEEYSPCDMTFEGQTTCQDAYKEWAVQKQETPAWAKRQVFKPPQVRFSASSSYQDAFKKPKVLTIVKSVPTPHQLDLTNGDNKYNYAKTQYQSEYMPYDSTLPSKSFKKVQNYEKPKEKMQGNSEYQARYTGKMTERASLCVPVPNKVGTDEENKDYKTTYNNTYQGQKFGDCPAKDIVLDKATTTVTLTSTDDNLQFQKVKNGHHYFQKGQSETLRPSPKVSMENIPATRSSSKSTIPLKEIQLASLAQRNESHTSVHKELEVA